MTPSDRYLQFDNIDMDEPVISSRCSACQRPFAASPKARERVDDVLLRIRVEFNAHECQRQTFSHSKKSAGSGIVDILPTI
jgi:hypothetical protein